MHRRRALLITLPLIAACGEERGFNTPENLLFLCVDTLRADQLGPYLADAEAESITPAIDSLAASGVVFEHAVSHASWTLPSFASILTSQYTSTHGCWTFETALAESFTTLPEIFQAEGFRTHGIASHVFFNEMYGLQQGFDTFDDELAHRREDEGWVKITSPLVTERAVDWLDERGREQDGPWLLWLHYFDPHIPYVDHERGGEASTRSEFDRYRSEIRHTDANLSAVFAALDRTGFAERTAVVFLSDHGESFYEHAGVFRHARSLYREELRVPLIVKVPGLTPRRVAGAVRTVDLLPTLLDVFQLRLPGNSPLEGASLLPTLLGAEAPVRPALAEMRLHDDAHHVRAVVEGDWKLIETRQGTYQLHDLSKDEEERTNLAGVYPERADSLRRVMEGLSARAAALGKMYARGADLEHSEADLKHLEAMGYVGDDPGSEGVGRRLEALHRGPAEGGFGERAPHPHPVSCRRVQGQG